MTLDSYAHQDVPFEQVVEALQPERSLSHSPLFQVMFVLQNAPEEELALPEVTLEPLVSDTLTTKFDLTLFIEVTDAGLVGTWEYSTDLFAPETIRRMSGHFQELLDSAVRTPDKSISKLSLLTQPERQQLLVEWNNTAVEYPKGQCIHELFSAQVKRTPESVAVVCNHQQLTYQELDARSNQLARYLQDLGVGPGVLVGICVERSLDMVVGLLGILKAGGAYVPLDPNYPKERLDYMLRDSAASVVLTQQMLVQTLPLDAVQVVCLDTDWSRIAQFSGDAVERSVQSDNLAYIIYTSGSTGTPKGVAIAHTSAATLVRWSRDTFSAEALQGVLASTSICFDLSVFELFVPLSSGGQVILALNALDLPNLPAAEKVTLINTVPSAITELLASKSIPSSTQTINLAGEALRSQLVQQLYQLEHVQQVCNLYGPSEDTTYSTFAHLEKGLAQEPSIGRPIANTQAYILDKFLSPVPIGVPGELFLGGDGLATGYLNRPDLTAEKFILNPFGSGRLYKTGDLARYLPDGSIEYLGRLDHQVKIRGFRIELGEVEAALSNHPHVQQAVITVWEARPDDKRLVAYVVSQDVQLVAKELQEFLKGKLPDYMVPNVFVNLETVPLTPNGKVNRRALPVPQSTLNRDTDSTPPRTPTERTIADIFAAVLGLECVGINSDFFELGGHSLLATQAIARLREIFQIELPLRTLFEAPTVADLSQRIQQTLTGQGERVLPVINTVSRDSDTSLPLSWSQERLWFLDQLEDSSAAYSIAVALKIAGPLDIAALEWALNGLLERHESLRTTFSAVEGSPRQVIAPVSTSAISVKDLSTTPTAQHADAVQQLIDAGVRTPFKLAEGPLLRLQLLRLDDRSHVLLMAVHHIIFDAWSGEIFMRELATLYQDHQQRKPSSLVLPSHQYADYAYWQRNFLSQGLEQQLDYWQQHLSGDLPILRLPTDYPQSTKSGYQGAQCSRQLSISLSKGLKALSQSEKVTLFMTLLAAFNLLLSRHTDQTDIIVGTPIAGRQHPGTEDLIGFFVNTLPLRVDLSDIQTFRELLGHVRDITLGAYSNQDVPFEQLVEVLQPERVLNRHPVFDVMLNLVQTSVTSLEMGGLDFELLDLPESESKFWMTLYVQDSLQTSVQESSVGLTLNLVYRRDLFSPERMGIFLAQFETLLEQIVATPDRSLHHYSLLLSENQPQLPDPTRLLNEPQFDPVAQLVTTWAQQHPENIAMTQGATQWTYGELIHYAQAIAHQLLDAGVQPGDVVGIYGTRSFALIANIVGIFLSKAVLLTLDPSLPQQRLQLMVEQAKSEYLVCLEPQLPTDWVPASVRLLAIPEWADCQELTQKGSDSSLPQVSGEDPAYIFFTSGSTGVPKGILGSHKGIAHFVHWQRETFDIDTTDRVAQLIRLSFDALLRDIFLPLTSGATLCLPVDEELSSDRILPWLEQERISVLHTVPTVAQYWVANAPKEITLPALRVAFFSGEPLTSTLVEQWRQVFPSAGSIVNLYGATETTMVKSYYPIPQQLRPGIQPAGWPLPQTQTLVLNADHQRCGLGEVGQIVVRTPFRTFGYINSSPAQAACFVPNPFRNAPKDLVYYTGDRGRYLPDGSLEVLDRLDDQLKIRGIRIQPGEIEALLNQLPEVRQSAVVARHNPEGNPVLVAYVVTRTHQDLDYERCYATLAQQLPTHLMPSAYVALNSLPLTPSGKIDRKALPIPDPSAYTTSTTVAPRTPTEAMLATILAEILERDSVGIHDNFFALGGHSLQATQVIVRIRKTFNLDLPLRTLFEAPTVAALAQSIEIRQQQQTFEEPAPPALKRSRRRVKRSADGKLILSDNLKKTLQE